MKLTFFGTRWYIKARNRRHRQHSALMVTYYYTDIPKSWSIVGKTVGDGYRFTLANH